ncbi:hypothetical protein HDU84_005694 [Entophlyctis sp. JEL0112]|nr:hypothetical protein HDU84_005694 [Entophlyctis sp. JEL0112]
MPGVIEVIIIMAIYTAIKNRSKGNAAKALVAQAFPGEMHAQVAADNAEIIAVYVDLQQVRAAKLHAARTVALAESRASARAKRASALASIGSFFSSSSASAASSSPGQLPAGPQPRPASAASSTVSPANALSIPDGDAPVATDMDDDADTATATSVRDLPSEEEDGSSERYMERPGTPTPTAPPPVDLSSPAATAGSRSLLSRFNLLGSTGRNSPPPPSSITADPSANAQTPVAFDAQKVRQEATQALLLFWAIIDALKKAAKARKIVNLAVKDNVANIDVPDADSLLPLPQDDEDNDNAANKDIDGSGVSRDTTPPSTEEADATIGKTQTERELQILQSLQTEALVHIIRAIQAVLVVLISKYEQAGVSYPSKEPSTEEIVGDDNISTSETVSGVKTANAKPPLVHDTSKYSPVLLGKLKLGWWGPVGMMLECSTREELVELLERTLGIWESQERDYDGLEDGDAKPSADERLFLVDSVLQVLRERGGVNGGDIEWV